MSELIVMTGRELAEKAKAIAAMPTAYFFGGIGNKITQSILDLKLAQYPKNAAHMAKAQKLIGKGYLFDCVCLIKAILWDWTQEKAEAGKICYKPDIVPDINADAMIKRCHDVSTDFSHVEVGEALWMSGHIGVYIGDGLGVECTPAFKGGVQITAVGNMGKVNGYPTRTWTKHGKLPWISYAAPADNPHDGMIKLIINGRTCYVPGEFRDDTNYLSGSVREIFTALGAKISADGTTPVIEL